MKLDWRRKSSWDAVGLVLTVAWFALFMLLTGGDLDHPLGTYVFLVPIGIWLAVILIKTRLKP